MNAEVYPSQCRSEVDVASDPERLFAALDDHRRLANHMEKPSLMTVGGSMRTETDSLHGQAVGSVIRMTGRGLGLLLGRAYAGWCTRRMADDAKRTLDVPV